MLLNSTSSELGLVDISTLLHLNKFARFWFQSLRRTSYTILVLRLQKVLRFYSMSGYLVHPRIGPIGFAGHYGEVKYWSSHGGLEPYSALYSDAIQWAKVGCQSHQEDAVTLVDCGLELLFQVLWLILLFFCFRFRCCGSFGWVSPRNFSSFLFSFVVTCK